MGGWREVAGGNLAFSLERNEQLRMRLEGQIEKVGLRAPLDLVSSAHFCRLTAYCLVLTVYCTARGTERPTRLEVFWLAALQS